MRWRYRPPPWDAENFKREIVLEYGPDRSGTKAENDVLPVVIENADTLESYVSWHNEGKVYYSQEIHALQYESATYMASVTGAVVVDVLRENREPRVKGVALIFADAAVVVTRLRAAEKGKRRRTVAVVAP